MRPILNPDCDALFFVCDGGDSSPQDFLDIGARENRAPVSLDRAEQLREGREHRGADFFGVFRMLQQPADEQIYGAVVMVEVAVTDFEENLKGDESGVIIIETERVDTPIEFLLGRRERARCIVVKGLRLPVTGQSRLDRPQLRRERRAHQPEAFVDAGEATIKAPEMGDHLLEFSLGDLMVLYLKMDARRFAEFLVANVNVTRAFIEELVERRFQEP
ncbi:MAG TPA: hypothetical protein VKU19_07605 [Bryobacteraceae bacterium]|nr:hypothetical protein [Bryobacteraceae bacterium]